MKKYIIILCLALCSIGASAQSTLKSGYFLERMPQRHKLNPALMSEYGYFSIPALGNINLGLNSNLSLDQMLYPLDNGNLGLFLHPEVDGQSFLDGLNDDNIVNQNLDLALFSMGFYGFGGFNTLDLSIHENVGLNLKRSVFDFLVGNEKNSSSIYNMGGNSLDLNTYAELAVGHAHRLNDHLTIGVKLKYLVGVANANLAIDQLDLTMTEQQARVAAHAKGTASLIGMPLVGKLDDLDLEDFSIEDGMSTGFGVDLGATYEWRRFNFSVALNDLGAIKWKQPSTVESGAEINFDGFGELDFEDLEGSTKPGMDDLNDQIEGLEDLTNFEMALMDDYKTKLYSKLNVGVEYDIVSDKISAGLLSTTTFGVTTISEWMLVANFRPASWFNVAVSGTTSNIGSSWGWVVNFCPRGLNLFIGSDHMITRVTPQFVPYNTGNFNINFGLSIPLGKVRAAN